MLEASISKVGYGLIRFFIDKCRQRRLATTQTFFTPNHAYCIAETGYLADKTGP